MRKIIFIISLVILCNFLWADNMPDFKLPDLNNKEVKLNDLLNKGPILIDFWATWCTPCKKGMVALNNLAQKYDSLTVVVISIDAPKDVAKAKSYLKTNKYKFIGLFDSDKKLANKLNVTNPPRTLILDKTGKIVYSHEGYESGNEKEYEKIIRELLSLPPLQEESEHPCPEPIKKHGCGGCQ